MKRYIGITKKSDTSVTVICHAMSMTVLYVLLDFSSEVQLNLKSPQTYNLI